MARFRVIYLLLLIVVLLVCFTSLVEFNAVSKLKKSYASFKKRDTVSTNILYSELKKSFIGSDVESPDPTTDDEKLAVRCETIHIGLVCSGHKSNVYVHTMLKSILFYRDNPLHFHIFASKFSENVLGTLFDTWDLPHVNVSFYEINKHISTIRWVPNSHYSGLYGLMKLLFPKVLPSDITKFIVLDTDLTFMADIFELWQTFTEFDELQAIGLVENESNFYLSKKKTVWPAIGRGFNTGVILYRIDRLNTFQWDKVWAKVTKSTAMTYGATSLGDQDIINSVLKQYPHLLYKVPCYWNTQFSYYTNSYKCYKYDRVKVVHWNSPVKQAVHNQDGAYFRSIYTTFLEMNGNLAKNYLNVCSNVSAEASSPSPQLCKEGKTLNFRTLLYFRNYEYDPQANDVTFLAHLSLDRMQIVETLCEKWEGPISLTFYINDFEFGKVNKYIEQSKNLKERTNIEYHAVFKDGDRYPINILRNVGLKNVKTPYVFLADIDFLPMNNLYETLKTAVTSLGNMDKKALVIPAFESQQYRIKFPKTKTELLQMLNSKKIFKFRFDVWASGHLPTDYERWKTAKQPYSVKWAPNYEPYVVVKSDVVQYDPRFMGFGWNKVSHIMELEAQKYDFIVLHNSFIVHQPHAPSHDIGLFRMSPVYRMCIKNLKKTFLSGLQKKYKRHFDNKEESADQQ